MTETPDGHAAWLKSLHEENLAGLWDGVRRGWWQDVDEEAMEPIREFKREEFHDTATWAHVWLRLGRFRSMKEAQRAGHKVPLTKETRRIGTYIVRIA